MLLVLHSPTVDCILRFLFLVVFLPPPASIPFCLFLCLIFCYTIYSLSLQPFFDLYLNVACMIPRFSLGPLCSTEKFHSLGNSTHWILITSVLAFPALCPSSDLLGHFLTPTTNSLILQIPTDIQQSSSILALMTHIWIQSHVG